MDALFNLMKAMAVTVGLMDGSCYDVDSDCSHMSDTQKQQHLAMVDAIYGYFAEEGYSWYFMDIQKLDVVGQQKLSVFKVNSGGDNFFVKFVSHNLAGGPGKPSFDSEARLKTELVKHGIKDPRIVTSLHKQIVNLSEANSALMGIYPFVEGDTFTKLLTEYFDSQGERVSLKEVQSAFAQYGAVLGNFHKKSLKINPDQDAENGRFEALGTGERHLNNVLWNPENKRVYLVDFNEQSAGNTGLVRIQLTSLFDFIIAGMKSWVMDPELRKLYEARDSVCAEGDITLRKSYESGSAWLGLAYIEEIMSKYASYRDYIYDSCQEYDPIISLMASSLEAFIGGYYSSFDAESADYPGLQAAAKKAFYKSLKDHEFLRIKLQELGVVE